MTSYGGQLSMKILCTTKSVKQQIWYFSHDLHSIQSLYKMFHLHVLFIFLALAILQESAINTHNIPSHIFPHNMHDIYFSQKVHLKNRSTKLES